MIDPLYPWLTKASSIFLSRDYLLPGQTLDERVNIIADRAGRILKDPTFAPKFVGYYRKGWYSFSTPIWTNFGTDRGLPISCFGCVAGDSISSILDAMGEVGMETKLGGGTSVYLGRIRERGALIRDNGEARGPVHFVGGFESMMKTISQGDVRGGNTAVYLDIDHPDIMEFLTIRSESSPYQDISFGVCVSDSFMERVGSRDRAAMVVWAKVLEVKKNTGFPYIINIDTANRNCPPWYGKGTDYPILASNLCSEILLPSSLDESFVCDLMSMNDLYFDDWEGTDAVKLGIYLIDAVMTEFIEKTDGVKYMERPNRFARRHRALGMGQIGWHSYLQSKGIPFESLGAKGLAGRVQREIYTKAKEASRELAAKFGEPEVLKGTGYRNTTVCAQAPTKSSAFIAGVSEGREPILSNIETKDLAKGKFHIYNPFLEKRLGELGENTPGVWESVLERKGSVQHLPFLSDLDKAVFKTFGEISPMEVLIQASIVQKNVDQGQSLNLMIHPDTPTRDINALYTEAWKLGLKSIYYQKSINAAQDFARNILECSSCEA